MGAFIVITLNIRTDWSEQSADLDQTAPEISK